jgi:hypothetical protein
LDIEANYVPHSGWAVLQIVLSYFETFAFFKLGGQTKLNDHHGLFKFGVLDTFPEFDGHNPSLVNMLYSQLRGGLYHSGVASGSVILCRTVGSSPVSFEPTSRIWRVDPHRFVVRLREHFQQYITALRNPENTSLREGFEAAFSIKYSA